MKRFAAVLLSAIMIFALTGCSASQPQATQVPAATQALTGCSASQPQATQVPAATQAPAAPTAADAGAAETPAATDASNAEVPVTTDAGNAEAPVTTDVDNAEAPAGEAASGSDILIAYFSVPETDGVDTVGGASRVAVDGAVLGNNQYVAQLIQQETGGDLFRIETVQEYPGNHDPLLDFAWNERADNARPELATQIEGLDRYNVIFLGYPNWNADLPMPLYTFLEAYDFSGKTIIPFTVHGGSGFSRTIQTIQELQPGATVVTDGLAISRNSVAGAQDEVSAWLASLDGIA